MNNKYLLRVFILLIGNAVAAVGVALTSFANFGVDPVTVLYQGICNVFSVEIGTASLIVNGILLILCLIFDKKSIKFGTVIAMVAFSQFLNIACNTLSIVITENIMLSILNLFIGILLMGVGFASCIYVNIGTNVADVMLGVIIKFSKKSMKLCKIVVDMLFTLVGWLLGGSVGIGTIACVFLVGIIYSKSISLFKKIK